MNKHRDTPSTAVPHADATEAYTIREVRLLQQAEAQIDQLRLVKIHEGKQTRYEIHFTVLHNTRYVDSILINTRNRPYHLADLNRGLRFLQTVFNRVNRIELIL